MSRDLKTQAPNLKIITDNFGSLKNDQSFSSINDSMYSVVSSSVLSSQFLSATFTKQEANDELKIPKFEKKHPDIKKLRDQVSIGYIEKSALIKKCIGNIGRDLKAEERNKPISQLYKELYDRVKLPPGFEENYEKWIEEEFYDIA